MLKEYREKKKVTQNELAKLLDTQQTMISKMERGERRIDILEFWNICKILNIPIVEFFELYEKQGNQDHQLKYHKHPQTAHHIRAYQW